MSIRGIALMAVMAAWSVGCSCGPSGSGLAITVNFEATSPAKCAIVGVRTETGAASFESKPLPRPADNALLIGVERTAQIRGRLVPYARPYAATDCSGTMLPEVKAASAVDLDLPGRQDVTLLLRGPDAGCVPTAELCTDGLDNDCDGRADCLDDACGGLGCSDFDACTDSDLCRADGGCEGAAIACTSPGLCEVAPGTCTGGVCGYDAGVGLVCNTNGVCRSDKSCADGGEVFCANAADDDLDLLTDCADPDCVNQACDGGVSRCFSGAVCLANACTPSAPVVCTPPNACFVSTGACVESTGCPFLQRAVGTPCDGGSCGPDGGCTGTAVELCTNGIDDDLDLLADCADPDCNTQACDDNNGCTAGTVCSAGVCGGGSVCPSSGFCSGVGTCGSDGGCQYAQPLFARCDAGLCRSDGTCGAPFPFTPSNFDPDPLNVPDASVKIDCVAEFDSTAFTGGFGTWCGPRPLVFVQSQGAGADEVVVLAMPNLDVTDAGSIYLIGSRPVILAVFGNASVGGRIVAGPRAGTADLGAGGSSVGIFTKPHCYLAGPIGRGGDGLSGNTTSHGGGGGAFAEPAGAGGVGAGLAGSAGTAGLANGNASLIPLRGGCPGGYGGTNYLNGAVAGGFGGGAVQLSVAGALTVHGYIAAPGLLGRGGNSGNDLNGGGSGAGSGGAVLLESATLRLFPSAAITAQGGGGGEGDGDPEGGGESGDDGQNGHLSNAQPALGGNTGSTRGGNGGNGAVAGTAAAVGIAGTTGSSRNGGGGGGGASVGRIRFNIVSQCRADAGIISPLFTGTCP